MIPRDYEEPVSFWEWVRTLLMLMIPVLGFILLIYWACSSKGKASRRNLLRAQICLSLVIAVPFVILLLVSPGFSRGYAGLLRGYAVGIEQHTGNLGSKNGEGTAGTGATIPAASQTSASEPTLAMTTPLTAPSTAGAAVTTPSASTAADGPPPTLTPDEPTRRLKSADGRTIEARVVSVTDDQVTIMRVNGQEFTVPMERFSAEDVAYFMRLRHGRDAFE